jgi:hypothetical protein
VLSILALKDGAGLVKTLQGRAGPGQAMHGRNLSIGESWLRVACSAKDSETKKDKVKMEDQIETSKSELTTRTERVQQVARMIVERGFGAALASTELSELSGYAVETKQLSFFVSDVREELAANGMWLSGEGQAGQGFFVVRPSENAVVASRFAGKAHRALLLMQTLLEKTPLDTMTDAERRRHEKELRELKYSNRLYARRQDVVKLVKKHQPSLLKEDIETETDV